MGMWDTAVDEKQPCPVQRCSKRKQCTGTWGICMMFSEVGKSQGQAVRSKRGMGGEDSIYSGVGWSSLQLAPLVSGKQI